MDKITDTPQGKGNQESIQDRIKFVQECQVEIADSLDFIKVAVLEGAGKLFLATLIAPMLEERANWIRERARELFLDLRIRENPKGQEAKAEELTDMIKSHKALIASLESSISEMEAEQEASGEGVQS